MSAYGVPRERQDAPDTGTDSGEEDNSAHNHALIRGCIASEERRPCGQWPGNAVRRVLRACSAGVPRVLPLAAGKGRGIVRTKSGDGRYRPYLREIARERGRAQGAAKMPVRRRALPNGAPGSRGPRRARGTGEVRR